MAALRALVRGNWLVEVGMFVGGLGWLGSMSRGR